MRTFKLINGRGSEQTLMYSSEGFFHSVSGLGYSDVSEYRRIGEIYKMIEDHRSQDEIKGKIIFRNPGAQQAYQNLIRFLQFKPITLVYMPEGLTEQYYRKGTVTEVAYSEADTDQVSVTFTSWTPPYQLLTLSTGAAQEGDEGKIYSWSEDDSEYGYRYSYREAEDIFAYRYRSTLNNTVEFSNDVTAMDCPCRITFYGPMLNPTWSHYVGDTQIAQGRIFAEIPANRKVVIDTENIPYSIKEYDLDGNEISDLYDVSDFGTERFFLLRYGKNIITISDDNSNVTPVLMEVQVVYASI